MATSGCQWSGVATMTISGFSRSKQLAEVLVLLGGLAGELLDLGARPCRAGCGRRRTWRPRPTRPPRWPCGGCSFPTSRCRSGPSCTCGSSRAPCTAGAASAGADRGRGREEVASGDVHGDSPSRRSRLQRVRGGYASAFSIMSSVSSICLVLGEADREGVDGAQAEHVLQRLQRFSAESKPVSP